MPRRSVDARCGFAAVGVTDRRVVTDLSFSIISAPSAAGASGILPRRSGWDISVTASPAW